MFAEVADVSYSAIRGSVNGVAPGQISQQNNVIKLRS
jgi:hypothetical protein